MAEVPSISTNQKLSLFAAWTSRVNFRKWAPNLIDWQIPHHIQSIGIREPLKERVANCSSFDWMRSSKLHKQEIGENWSRDPPSLIGHGHSRDQFATPSLWGSLIGIGNLSFYTIDNKNLENLWIPNICISGQRTLRLYWQARSVRPLHVFREYSVFAELRENHGFPTRGILFLPTGDPMRG